MKRMFIEDRNDMVWVPVCLVGHDGRPTIGACAKLRDEDIARCVEWCERYGHNWIVSEIVSEIVK